MLPLLLLLLTCTVLKAARDENGMTSVPSRHTALVHLALCLSAQ